MHSKQNGSMRKRLLFVISMTFLYMLAEAIGGLLANSLALLADAGHMLGDLTALSMSLWASKVSEKPASAEKTYGYYRTEVVVALANGLLLVVIGLFIISEGIKRAISPPEVEAPLMIAIAAGGLIINLIGLLTLHSSAKHNLNVKGAFFNILGDTFGSIGAISAGLIIYFYKFYYADLIISFIVASLLIYTASGLIREASNVLLEATPSHLDTNKIKNALMSIDNVINVHELHVWAISQDRIALSVHVVCDCPDGYKVLQVADSLLQEKFNIRHLTIQVEPVGFPGGYCDF